MAGPAGHRPQEASSPGRLAAFFSTPTPLYASAVLLRLAFLLYGLAQDALSPVKYTDIDYLVFTDAARFVARLQSPYARETYRYTPLLAWLLVPTAWKSSSGAAAAATAPAWAGLLATAAAFSSGKVLFAAADIAAGALLEAVLRMPRGNGGGGGGMAAGRARAFAAIWLLNPMVATISTRGSSEGLLGVLVAALLWAALQRRVALAGALLGFGVHFKIYPFIYAPAIVWWMDRERMAGGDGVGDAGKRQPGSRDGGEVTLAERVRRFVTPERVSLAVISLGTFLGLNLLMFLIYGTPFIQHTFLHHVTRLDHRHNFSPYNVQLYLSSALSSDSSSSTSGLRIESVAFVPQLLLSCVLIPLVMAKKDLPSAMLAQTFAFVTFNKVCTSQYFLWYMVLLPLYLPRSSFLRNKVLGITALVLWVASQGAWLQQGFELEFLGKSTFVPGLWLASLGFFLVNCWILGIIIGDVALE